jgi:hypothetical protein
VTPGGGFGWVCPKCGTVYAPSVLTCWNPTCKPQQTVPSFEGTSAEPLPKLPTNICAIDAAMEEKL